MAEIHIHDSEDYIDGLGEINPVRGTAKMVSSDGKSDAFIVDLECFSNGGLDKDVSSKSRMNMQRSFTRKVPLPGSNQDQESLLISSSSFSSSPNEMVGENSVVAKEMSSNQRDDQPSMETGNVIASKSKWRRSVKRSPPPNWFSDPKRVLLFFATLSSLGTILLIYFTLSMRKSYENVVDSNVEWET